jgi:hypothetical protein
LIHAVILLEQAARARDAAIEAADNARSIAAAAREEQVAKAWHETQQREREAEEARRTMGVVVEVEGRKAFERQEKLQRSARKAAAVSLI